jgi:serine/threonine protein phosphatase PrpC
MEGTSPPSGQANYRRNYLYKDGYTVPENHKTTSPQATQNSPAHRIAFKTDIGRSYRVNQDAGGAWTWVRPDGVPVSLLVVADGVSAGRRSEDVSRLVSQFLLDRMRPVLVDPSRTANDLIDVLAELVREANHEVASRPHVSPASADATTLVAAFCVGESGGGVWVGDSRVYRIDDAAVSQLTRDHSWTQGAVSQGIMTVEQAASDPRAHMITRWVGPPDQDDPGVETFSFDLSPGAVILCCSDGLYGYFSSPVSKADEMARIVESHVPDLQAATDHLVDLALERGGHDNITIAALQLEVGT